MSKIYIMQGLPASGKSTMAKKLTELGGTVRINKDLLRTMLHFNKWSGNNEGITRAASRDLARNMLLADLNVIIDDTNLNEGTLQSWVDLAKECGAKIEHIKMKTSMQECIERDENRFSDGTSVGRDVIVGMALQSGLYPKPEKGFVLCDLDGTLADITHRLHYVNGEKKDWKGFFEHMMLDTPRIEVVDMLLKYEEEGYEIIFVSARPDNYRAFTRDWIVNTAFKGYEISKTLIMRQAGDKRPDTEVKYGVLQKYFKKPGYKIHCVIDDRPSVIRMWRENGVEVIDVGKGIEF